MAADVTLALWLLMLGPCMGSFLATFAERFCTGESLLARSRCQRCRTRLLWWELVPIVSWLVLRGRCHHCGHNFGWGLFAAEVAGGLVVLAAILAGETIGQEAVGAIWLWCLVGLFLTDRRCLRLPDALTFTLLCAGLYLGAQGSIAGLVTACATAVAGSLTLWLLGRLYVMKRRREGLGLGDVKMIAGIGAAVGPVALPWVTLLAALGILMLAIQRNGGMLRLDSMAHLPFGSALAIAGAIVWLAGRFYGSAAGVS